MSLNRVCFSKKITYFSLATALLFFCLVYLSQRLLTQRQSSTSKAAPVTNKSSIIGGTEVQKGEYPYVAYVYAWFSDRTDAPYNKCSGVLLSQHWLLTAKHCIVDDYTGKDIFANATFIYYDNPDISSKQVGVDYDSMSTEYYAYQFDPNNQEQQFYTADLIMVKLQTPATISKYPSLPPTTLKSNQIVQDGKKKIITQATLSVGKYVTLLGYGCREPIGQPTNAPVPLEGLYIDGKLRKISLPVLKIIDHQSLFNVGFKDERNYTSSACGGDSGGPGLIHHNGKDYLVGLMHSAESGQAPYPTFLVDIRKYSQWIEYIMNTYSN